MAPVALRVCGLKKSPEGVPLLLFSFVKRHLVNLLLLNFIFHTIGESSGVQKRTQQQPTNYPVVVFFVT
jgi:hypothetical protein